MVERKRYSSRKWVVARSIHSIGTQLTMGVLHLTFMDETILRNCEHYLLDPIEIPSNEKTEAYPFLKYKLRI